MFLLFSVNFFKETDIIIGLFEIWQKSGHWKAAVVSFLNQ